jgi:peptidoglycan/LPS O-acetylase OafA/YrhL
LASRPLRWRGERSYGLYLWHWALVSWTAALPLPVGIPLALVGSLAVTEASWRFLERPLLVSGRRPRAGAPVVRWRWRGAMVDVGAQPASAGRPV